MNIFNPCRMPCLQNAVIAFILRVFPSITVGKLPEPAFLPCLSVPVTLISLLGAVDMHIRKYADFTLQRSFVCFFRPTVSDQFVSAHGGYLSASSR